MSQMMRNVENAFLGSSPGDDCQRANLVSHGGEQFSAFLFVALVFFSILTVAPARERITLAVLPPQNTTGEADCDHWQYTLALLLKAQLQETEALCILPRGSGRFQSDSCAQFCCSDLSKAPGAVYDLARETGRKIGADRVVWGNYAVEGQNRRLTVWVAGVGTGDASGPFTAEASDWLGVVCKTRRCILKALGVVPTPEEKKKMDFPVTTSALALEFFSRALGAENAGDAAAAIEQYLRQSIALDPNFAIAQESLGSVLAAQNLWDEAADAVRNAIALRPDRSVGHQLLGEILFTKGAWENSKDEQRFAKQELLKAKEMDPENPDTLESLGLFYGHVDDKWEEAISLLRSAQRLSPNSASLHMDCVEAYFNLAQRDKALEEAQITESCLTTNSEAVLSRLAGFNDALNDTEKAANLYERFIARAEPQGVFPLAVQSAYAALRRLKPRLTPHFVPAVPPQSFTPEALKRALRARLTPHEFGLAKNPLAATPQMAKFAHQLVGDAPNDMEKARRLFYGLVTRIDFSSGFNPPFEDRERTAAQTFKAWSDPWARIVCQDYAFLYVALAREVGLQAWPVWIIRDCRGRLVSHVCAGVFVNGKTLLADPSYRWFGAPHEEYQFEDDLQAIAAYMAQSRSDTIALDKLAEKLMPDWPWVRFCLAMDLAQEGRFPEARMALQSGIEIDSKIWWGSYAQGVVDVCEKKGAEAVKRLREALNSNPDFPLIRYELGRAYQLDGKLRDAREEFCLYLQGDVDWRPADDARRAIDRITRQLQSEDKANHLDAAAYAARASTFFKQGMYLDSIEDCSNAIQLEPKNPKFYLLRSYAYYRNHEENLSLADLSTAIDLNPRNATALDQRGYAYMEQSHFEQPLADFYQSIWLDPTNYMPYAHLAWVRASCPVAFFRNGKEALDAAKRACEQEGCKEFGGLELLAAAYAETGDFDAAIKYQKQALAAKGSPAEMRENMASTLRLYEQHRPHHFHP